MITNEPTYIKIQITPDVYHRIQRFKDGWEGQEVVDVMVSVDMGNGRKKEVEFTMSEFLEVVGLGDVVEAIKPCETCFDSREVTIMDQDSDGNFAPTASKPCPDCQVGLDDEPEQES